jgi:RHS repeat-associated protein
MRRQAGRWPIQARFWLVWAGGQLQGRANGYDDAGNMTHDLTSGKDYTYDQENRSTGAAGYTYTYDANGNRVEKLNGTTGTLYWYMTPGIVAESDLAGNLQSEYVFFDGERVARKDLPSNNISYYFSDNLKTAAVITDAAGNIKSESDYYPWGGELQFANGDSNHYKFTGKERDSESSLDYFGARYNGSSLGRFTSPDPGWFFATHPAQPQSWNLYSYVLNNPLTFIDPDGFDCVYLNDKGTDVVRDKNGEPIGIDQHSSQEECAASGGGHWVDGTVTQVTLFSNSDDVALNGKRDDGTDSYTYDKSVSAPRPSYDESSLDPYVQIAALYGKRRFDPWPIRLYGTHWCGPGGGGVPVNALDSACKAHDECFDAVGLSAADNSASGRLTLQQAVAASGCNAALGAAAAAHPELEGSTRVSEWLKHGDQLLALTGGRIDGHLAPGTATR